MKYLTANNIFMFIGVLYSITSFLATILPPSKFQKVCSQLALDLIALKK